MHKPIILFLGLIIISLSPVIVQGKMIDNRDGTITAQSTCLTWQKAAPEKKMTWKQALSYCENLRLAGKSDWRLPNVEELRSIVDYSKYDPSIDEDLFPNTMSAFYWSSTSSAHHTGYAWGIYFGNGGDDHFDKDSSYFVRAVRGGQCGSFDNSDLWSPQVVETRLPPVLTIEKITFSEKVLDALEQAEIAVTLKNIGPGNAQDVQAILSTDTAGILLPESTRYPEIAAEGGKHTLRIPVKTSMKLPDARAEITIQIIEPHFKVNIQGKRLVFSTRAFKQPNLKLVRFAVTEQTSANINQQIDINEIIDVKLAVQNLGKGTANDVSIQIQSQQKGVMLLGLVEGNKLFRKSAQFSSIRPGQYRTITFRYFVNSEFSGNTLRFDIQGAESYQQFGFKTTKAVAVNTTLQPEGHIQKVAFDDPDDQGEVVIENVPEFVADIDQSIPKTRMKNPHAVALVIGNRDYKKTDRVQYAINDALSMKRYLTHVMGYAEKHVFLIKNASKGDFETYLGHIGDVYDFMLFFKGIK